MLEISGKSIYLTRGDTMTCKVTIYNRDGTEYTPDPEDVITFALKRKYSDLEPLIEKIVPTDTMKLRLEASETSQLTSNGPYVFDLQIEFPDGTVDTFFDKGRLYITEDV